MKLGFIYNNSLIKKIRMEPGATLELMIGRSPKANIIIPLDMISSFHAQLVMDNSGVLYLIDQDSTNGTYVNNVKLNAGTPKEINKGDQISLGKSNTVSVVFNPDDYVAGVAPPQSGRITDDTKANTNLLSKLKEKSIIYIGRGEEADLVLDHPTISRVHALIEKKSDSVFFIKDLGSTNGTFLNGKRVTSATMFTDEDVIFIGRFKLTLKAAAKDLSREIAIRADRIIKVFQNEKVGLHESTFEVSSNKLMAVMGPSGCGKSTLLKALNGASPATTGSVFICGLELSENYDYLKTQIGYVPQDDIVHSELTVEQSLWYAAKLRLQNANDAQINEKINQVLDNLKIQHIRDQLVGKISGGQRKRVSIAVEVLNDPMILFLDEPTSPLDPQTIEDFLGSLRKLCDNGTTVILVTHKPEDLHYVDTVIFMAEGGHMVYNGSAKSYLSYFDVTDAVKVYSNLAGDKADKWIGRYNSNNRNNNPDVNYENKPINYTSKTNYFSQYWWLTMRYFNIKFNDKANTAIMIGQAPIIALLVCLIYDRIELSVPFLLTVSAVWFGANNAAREIVGELPIYIRERMFNQGIFPYIASKITVLGTFAAVQSFLFTVIITLRYNGVDSELHWNNPLRTFLLMLLLSISATMLGLLLSAIVSTTEKVMTLVPLVLIPQIMLAGMVAKITTIKVELLSYLTLSRWGTEGFCNIQKEVMMETPKLDAATGKISMETASKVDAVERMTKNFHSEFYEKTFGSYQSTLKLDVIVILVLSLLFFISICIALKQKDTIKIKQ